MTYYALKVAISAILIVSISELAKRSTIAGALLASLPLVSLLAMIWLYAETRNVAEVVALSRGIFWLVLPSLALFLVLPALLERGYNFYLSLAAGAAVTIVAYGATLALLRHFGIRA
jgi:hypothetical protein